MSIPTRKLGKTAQNVTILGLGGEGVLRTFGREQEAYALINRAIDLGLNYFESARAYSGSESYYGLTLKERRKDLFLASKSHARDKQGARNHLRETLENMATDYIDLWQVHDMRSRDDISAVFGPQGAIEAFVEAKERGQVRFIGVTGHHDPAILAECLKRFDFDTVLMPINPAEPHYKSFIREVLPFAEGKGLGIIAMKVYVRGFATRLPWLESLEPLFRFALSQSVSTAVIGCDSVSQLEENVRFAERFAAMSHEAQGCLVEDFAPVARNLLYYKP